MSANNDGVGKSKILYLHKVNKLVKFVIVNFITVSENKLQVYSNQASTLSRKKPWILIKTVFVAL